MLLDFVKLKDIKPALSGYISDSLALLERSDLPDEDAVHDIRVLMKKARATLRLLKTQSNDGFFDREYLVYREIGRLLTTWRECSVHRKAMKMLGKENPGLFARLEDNEQIKCLLSGIDSPLEASPEVSAKIGQIHESLKKASYRLRFESLGVLDPQLLLKELEQTYIVVSEEYLRCRNYPKPECLHELRKRSKDFLYQLYYFRPLNSQVIKRLEKKLDLLAQNLGKYNDLTQIIRISGYKYGSAENTPALNELIIVIKNKQDRYLSKIWPVAYEIFCPGQKLLNVLGFKLLVI
jgi:CHAD domain-containing protein